MRFSEKPRHVDAVRLNRDDIDALFALFPTAVVHITRDKPITATFPRGDTGEGGRTMREGDWAVLPEGPGDLKVLTDDEFRTKYDPATTTTPTTTKGKTA